MEKELTCDNAVDGAAGMWEWKRTEIRYIITRTFYNTQLGITCLAEFIHVLKAPFLFSTRERAWDLLTLSGQPRHNVAIWDQHLSHNSKVTPFFLA